MFERTGTTRSPRGVRAAGGLLIFALAAAGSVRAQLGPIESEFTTVCFGQGNVVGYPSYGGTSCFDLSVISDSETQAFVDVQVSVATSPGGGLPFARAEGQGSADFVGGTIVLQGIGGVGRGVSELYYELSVNILQPTPVVLPSVPVAFVASGTVTTSHSGSGGGSSADASFRLVRTLAPIPPLYEVEIGASNPPFAGRPPSDAFTFANVLNAQLGVAYGVILEAEIVAHPSAGYGGAGNSASSAQAFVDPEFSFDQAAFDAYAAQQGFETFPLEDYLAIEFSEVPEPAGGVAVGLLGIVLLAGARRRAAHDSAAHDSASGAVLPLCPPGVQPEEPPHGPFALDAGEGRRPPALPALRRLPHPPGRRVRRQRRSRRGLRSLAARPRDGAPARRAA